ncbi:ribonucleotide reductase large subunit [Harp seal herpesvirus]|uniref:Ribonucleoside-diphosphate reductase n=1 Tax=phocid gammaherpesvirus 3 TaxID=2560643 RepID=A0A0R5ZDU1_9GAMA|nr:ribonucleotide reductase large subunit [Harp seal herpesvirus]AJG42988.1 ribonucleotide reductase large subunit [Harp seal herpesvirus]
MACLLYQNQEAALQTLINSLKLSAGWSLEANKMAGRLEHMRMSSKTPKTTLEYLHVFGSLLKPYVRKFLRNNYEMIDNVCAAYKNSAEYEHLVSRGYLSAKRFYDTYVLKTETHYESPVQTFVRMSAFFTCQVFKHQFLQRSLEAIQLDNWGETTGTEEEVFNYFFEHLSSMLVCCATPVMRSAGVIGQNLASCFILAPDVTSEENTISVLSEDLAPLLQSKSGVGMDVTTFTKSGKNILSCLKLINSQVEFFNDNNIRPVSVAAYLELWHEQVEDFLSAKLPENPERCSAIFQGVCIPSLFFRLYEQNPDSPWYLFSSDVGVKLKSSYGEQFDSTYQLLVDEKMYTRVVSVKSLMFMLINTIIKTGSPYILLKEALNEHHWHDTQDDAINCANLCAEVIQQPGEETAVCNLANICLPRCLVPLNPILSSNERNSREFKISVTSPDFIFSDKKLSRGVQAAVFMVNCSILGGAVPTMGAEYKQAERSMGIGVQGLADVFAYLNMSYDDPKSARLDAFIFEQLYFHSVNISNKIVTLGGATPFDGFNKSKLSKGIFHWEGWGLNYDDLHYGRWVWENLRESVMKHGTFNSQFVALMPTAGTSQLTGYAEAFYPFYANISSKVSNKEEIVKPNITFLEHLKPADLHVVKKCGGDITELPEELQRRYKPFLSAFDISPELQIVRAKSRAPFVDQSQSFSFFLKEQNVKNASYLKNLLILGYKFKLKTIMYYCRIQKQSSLTAFECLDNNDVTTLKENTETEHYKEESHSTEKACALPQNTDCLACQ